MASELKPCPFCGAEARLIRERPGFGMIQCTDCGCNVRYEDFCPEDRAVAEWNRRAVDTDALLTLAAQFECGSGVWLTGREVADRIREAVGHGR